jgi:hypothetical protein
LPDELAVRILLPNGAKGGGDRKARRSSTAIPPRAAPRPGRTGRGEKIGAKIFLRAHPFQGAGRLELDISFSDRIADLAEDGYDLAIRTGDLVVGEES